jgi:hypothetical protein
MRNTEKRFVLRQLLTNAVAFTSRERNERERMPLRIVVRTAADESRGNEFLRLWPVQRIAMDVVKTNA